MSVETSKRIEEDTMGVGGQQDTAQTPDQNPDQTAEASRAWSAPLPDFHSLGVGHALKIRRETLGWSLPDVAAWLCIKQSYLEALEHDRADTIPAGVYALGFLRTYAAALGFPAEAMVARFKREVRNVAKKPELTFLTPEPERTVPASAFVLAGLFVIVLAYVGWYEMGGHEPVHLEKIPSVASVMPGVNSAASPSPQIATVMPDAAPSVLNGSTPPALPAAQPDASSHVSADEFAKAVTMPPEQSSAVPGSVGSTSSENAAVENGLASPEIPAPPKAAEIRATAKSWIQVKDADGKVVYDHIMEPEETWEFPKEGAPFTLTVGNAGGVVLAVDNVVTQPLGKDGAVRRNISVSDDAIRDGSVAALAPKAGGAVMSPAVVPDDAASAEEKPPIPLPPPPVVKPRVLRSRSAPPEKELSADDLNARQLKNMGDPR
ncbi:MAG: RodZ domain-containing protein [Acetobacter sp.]|uniref:helix-turn-helix domain-containing protein n=1 Tax=Acetobacter sp. TaxID=440 RepID=UPI0039E77613